MLRRECKVILKGQTVSANTQYYLGVTKCFGMRLYAV